MLGVRDAHHVLVRNRCSEMERGCAVFIVSTIDHRKVIPSVAACSSSSSNQDFENGKPVGREQQQASVPCQNKKKTQRNTTNLSMKRLCCFRHFERKKRQRSNLACPVTDHTFVHHIHLRPGFQYDALRVRNQSSILASTVTQVITTTDLM